MANQFEVKLGEWIQWYDFNRNNSGDVLQQIRFLKRSVDGLMSCLALAAQEIRKAQGRPVSHHLWLPAGMTASGSMHHFD
jgi:hypothetical protein